MGYRNDQFFGLNTEESGEHIRSNTRTRGGWHTPANNALFRYPDRAIRTNDHEGFQTKYLKRGYIRSLPITNNGVDITARKKCQFQFNPTTLQQSVSQTPNMTNILFQDPSMYSRPMPGNSNFTFNLIFDRSMELNNASLGFDRFNTANPWERSDPSQIGVLADLSVLFATIGQGVSQSQLQFASESLSEIVKIESNTSGSGRTVYGQVNGVQDAPGVDVQGEIDSISALLNANIGNAGLLLPLPVRVVFSSLYILEGYVTNSSVTFTKFNTSMVPMQCAVSLTMEAKYIGFARKDTFLTWSLAESAKAQETEFKAEVDRVTGIQDAFQEVAGLLQMKLILPNAVGRADGRTWPDGSGWSANLRETLESNDNWPFHLAWRLPNVKKDEDDGVTTLMDDGTSVSVNVIPSLKLYGPYDNSIVPFTGNQSDIRKVAGTTNLLGDNAPIISVSSTWDSAATTKESWWKQGTTAVGPRVADTMSIHDDEPPGNQQKYTRGDYYFIAVYEVLATAIVNEEVFIGRGSYYARFSDLEQSVVDGLIKNVQIQWPKTQVVVDDTDNAGGVGTVPGGNVATDPPRAGSTSSVGRHGNRVN